VENYYELVSQELLNKLSQIKLFIKKHNPTIGVLTEEILRDFLRRNLPKIVSVEQGFILTSEGELSKQCDIIIYNSLLYSPFYRINDIIVVPKESVVAVVEVKTTINKKIFHNAIDYFNQISSITPARKYLFIYNSESIVKIDNYFNSYKHQGDYQEFDHDTFQDLPDEITGINESFHLKKDCVITDGDYMGYTSYFYEDREGTEINALLHFYLSIYEEVEAYIQKLQLSDKETYGFTPNRSTYYKKSLFRIRAIELFDM
jgi:hypothetical protein